MTEMTSDTRTDSIADAQRALIRLCGAGFVAYCSYAICRAPLLPLFARGLGADAPMVGFVVGASTLTGIALKLPAGAWSDVLGRRPLLVAGGLVFALLPLTYLGVGSLGALVALRFVHGSATAIFGPVASASLSDIAPATRRATWLSTYSTTQAAGQALGPIVAGYLIASGRFDLAFITAAGLGMFVPLIVSAWPRTRTEHTLADAAPISPVQQFVRGVSEIVRERLILATSAAQAAQYVLNGTLNAFLPLFARDVLGLHATLIGWTFGVQTLTILATRPVMGIAADRLGHRRVIVAGLTLCGAAVVLLSFATALATLLPAIVAYAIGVAVTTAATSAFITDLARRAHYGAAHGVFGTIYDVGDALGPIAAGLLVAHVGYGHTFRIMGSVTLTAAVLFSLVSHRRS